MIVTDEWVKAHTIGRDRKILGKQAVSQ
jgi:hypothetical protein